MPDFPGASAVSALIARLGSLWRGFRRRADIEAEMTEEFRHHLELRTEDLVRGGLPAAAARRQARIEFGHIESHKEDARASRGLRFFDQIRFSALDVKLGVRMLMKYPGLSLVSVIGMSVAIAIGAVGFGTIATIVDPTLPLDEGDRVVSIRNWDVRTNQPDSHVLHDFLQWKADLASVRDLGAFRSVNRNLLVAGRAPQLVEVAEMTASGFQLARVSPVLGRVLLEEDEREGAPPVVVIAHEEWQRLFNGDRAVLGRTVRLGSTVHTVIGVMPEGFRFPISHRFWVALRLNEARHARGEGPAISVFGRLADGATLDVARAELATIGTQMAAAFPATNEHVRPRITLYTLGLLGIDSPALKWLLRSIRIVISMLLILVAVNVAILVYARTATRTGEIALRTALGASRRRIVAQLFVEALVLSMLSAAVGLTIAGLALENAVDFLWPGQRDAAPFWANFGLSAGVVAYVAGLAIVAGVIVGVLPALKATGRRVQANLKQLSSRGSQTHLGRTWTALIVAQVAVAVAVLPFASYFAGESLRRAGADVGYQAEQFLGAGLVLEREETPASADAAAYERAFRARFVERGEELLRRLEAEPGVAGVTFRSQLEGYPFAQVEAESGESSWVFIDRVDFDLFAVFDVPILAGRNFVDADRRMGSNGVIVNRVFADRLFGGGNALGRRIRYVRGADGARPANVDNGAWLEIVGVVPDFSIQGDFDPPHLRLYEPVALATLSTPVKVAVRVRGNAAPAFAQRFTELAAAVDPALQLHDLQSAADSERLARRSLSLVALGIAAVVLSVVLLSAAGIYAMMSFTVARRRREIGIRSALGANARRLLMGIFARASAQLGAGVFAGLALAFLVEGPIEGTGLVLLPAVAVFMMLVGLLATLGPARRGLAIQPTEALREE